MRMGRALAIVLLLSATAGLYFASTTARVGVDGLDEVRRLGGMEIVSHGATGHGMSSSSRNLAKESNGSFGPGRRVGRLAAKSSR